MEQSSSNQHQQKLADMVAHFRRHYPINRKPMTPWHKQRMQEGAREYQRFLKAMKKEGKTWAR